MADYFRRLRAVLPSWPGSAEDPHADIRKAIADLPRNNSRICEGRIRLLYERKINVLEDENKKENLMDELRAVACYGLDEDLRDMMEKNGLAEEFALELVLQYKTTLPLLAKYLYSSNKDSGEVGEQRIMAVIRERFGQELEVLGGLQAKNVNIEQKWVKKLCKATPSLQSLLALSLERRNSLCEGANREDMAIVSELVRDAQAAKRTEIPVSKEKMDEKKAVEDKKKADVEDLNKARELMNEARGMAETQATKNKEELDKKFAEISKALELPGDWRKSDSVTPNNLIDDLDEIIQQRSKVVESPTQSYYNSNDVDLVIEASGGRALRGIYYSEYKPPRTAGQKILLPPHTVQMFRTNQPKETRDMKFTAQGAANDFVKTVESTSSNTGVAVKGFYNLFVGEVGAAQGAQSEQTNEQTVKSTTSSVSVLRYISITKKEFQIEQDQMNFTELAKQAAKNIGKSGNGADDARSFMDKFGSHVPGGNHKLGGTFYSMADAHSHKSMETSIFTTKAVERLQTQISAGFFGGTFAVAGSVTSENSSTSGKAVASHREEEEASYSYSMKVIGPLASNPTTFEQLLAYNTTWAIIDRGEPVDYIPVWQLIRQQGSEFHAAADVLEETWKEEEQKNKKHETMAHMFERKKLFISGNCLTVYNHRPTNGKKVFEEDNLKIENAYDKAIELIMKDPEHRICKIVYWVNIVPGRAHYSLICWEADDDVRMTFETVGGGHVLFFSELRFKWRNFVPSSE